MKTFISCMAVLFILINISYSALSGLDISKSDPKAILLNNTFENETFARPDLTRAELCHVKHAGDAEWMVSYWITGDEEYLAYQDPELTCPAPYPFTITEVCMVLYFQNPTIIYASANIKTADDTDPSCPVPGDPISVSTEYGFQIDPPGLWRIVIPLDEPLIVNEPYFAGFYIATLLQDPGSAAQDSVSLITDNVPVVCRNYNFWGETVDYFDLGDNTTFNFPGQLILYSTGQPADPNYTCGDIDGQENINLLDIVYLINYKFKNGPEPQPVFAAGDVDGVPGINILDIIYLINYIYKDGPDLLCP